MKTLQAHERVMSRLVKQIFSRQLKPGDKLPSERQLVNDIHVGRASLRIALKHLEMMNVLTIRQGDGIYVRDYMKSASLDFLRMLFLTEKPDDEWLVDPYTMDEICKFWVFFLPEMLQLAAKRITPRDFKTITDILDEELANLHDRNSLIELELKFQETIAEIGNNIVAILITHSCRPLFKKMIEIFYSSLDEERIKRHIEMKKELMHSSMILDIADKLSIIEQYRELLNSYHVTLYKLLFKDSDKEVKRMKINDKVLINSALM